MALAPNTAALTAIQGTGQAPPEVGAQAQPIAPLAAAGVDLAKRTMWMIGIGAIAIFLLVGLSECSGQNTAKEALDRHAGMIASVSLQKPDPELRELANAIARSADDPRIILPANATILLDRISTSGIADPEQVKVIDQCKIPPAEAKARSAALKQCAEALNALTAVDSAANQKIGFMAKIQESIAAERAAARAFWLQVAQLMLINLLLPILTALLGYIFGTQRTAAG